MALGPASNSTSTRKPKGARACAGPGASRAARPITYTPLADTAGQQKKKKKKMKRKKQVSAERPALGTLTATANAVFNQAAYGFSQSVNCSDCCISTGHPVSTLALSGCAAFLSSPVTTVIQGSHGWAGKKKQQKTKPLHGEPRKTLSRNKRQAL